MDLKDSIHYMVNRILRILGLLCVMLLVVQSCDAASSEEEDCYRWVCNETLWQVFGWNYDNYSYFLDSSLYAKNGYPEDFIISGLTKDSYIYHTCSGDFCPALMKANWYFTEAFRNMSNEGFDDEYLLNRSIFFVCIGSSYLVDVEPPLWRMNESMWPTIFEHVLDYHENLSKNIEFDLDLPPFEIGCQGLGCMSSRGVSTSIRKAVERERHRFRDVLEQLKYRPAMTNDGMIYIEELFVPNESNFDAYIDIFNPDGYPRECAVYDEITRDLGVVETVYVSNCSDEVVEKTVERVVYVDRPVNNNMSCPVCPGEEADKASDYIGLIFGVGAFVVGFLLIIIVVGRTRSRFKKWVKQED